jgi:hypothetical protein
MSPTTSPDRRVFSRPGRILAGTLAATLTVGGVALVGAQSASAAGKPLAQSVGNFLDGKLGAQTLDSIVKLDYATARAPGSASVQNPLHVKALNAIDLPLTGALQLPQILGINLGAANQVASANVNGQSFGAAGAVNNSGGVSVGGGSTSTPPTAAKIDLTASGVTGGTSLPIPGLPALPGLPSTGASSLDALGGIQASIGAVSSLAQTAATGKSLPSGQLPARSSIAGLDLTLGSPALGALLGQVTKLLDPSVLTGLLKPVTDLLGTLNLPGVSGAKTDCALTGGSLPTTITLESGAIVISPTNGSITIHLAPLVKNLLGYDITNPTTSNFDLIDFLVKNLGPILSQGLSTVVTSLVEPLQTAFQGCLNALGAVGGAVTTVLTTLTSGADKLTTALSGVATTLSKAGATGLAALGTTLKQVIDIGLNVQSGPGIQTPDSKYPFTTQLAATPKQGTPVVSGQTLVRAIEIHLIGDPVATIALANAAAGPSSAAPATRTSAPTTTANPTAIPTGVPAGLGTHGGSPVAPIVLLIVGLMMAAGGAVAFKVRGNHVG